MSAKKKGRFRPLRFIFGVLGSIIGIIILIPFIMILLMFDFGNYQPPIDDWTPENQFTFGAMVSERIDMFLANESEDIDLTLTAPQVNAMLISTFQEMNEDYLNPDAGDAGKFVFLDGEPAFRYGLRGVTAYISDDVLRVDAGLHLIASFGDHSFTFRIRLRLDLLVQESVEGFVIQIQRVNISNLPIRPIFGLATRVLAMLDIDLEETLTEELPFGTLDVNNLKFSLTYDDIFSMLGDSEEGDSNDTENTGIMHLLSMLATQTFGPDQRRLFDFGLQSSADPNIRGELALSLNFGLFRTTQPAFVVQNPITTQDELDNLFSAQISNMLFSVALGNVGDGLFLDLREEVLNQIVQYMMADGDAFLATMEFNLGEELYILEIENPFIEINQDELNVLMFMSLTRGVATEDDNSGEIQPAAATSTDEADSFRSLFRLTTSTPTIGANGLDLVLSITSISLGDFGLDADMISTILSIVETDMIQGNSIVIEDFAANIVQDGISLEGIRALPGVLRISVETEQDENIQAIVDEVRNTLPKVLDELGADDGPLAGEQFDDVRDKFNNLRDQINDDETDPEDIDIEGLVDAINNLPNEDKETLFNELTDSLNGHMQDSDLAGLIPNFDPSSLPIPPNYTPYIP